MNRLIHECNSYTCLGNVDNGNLNLFCYTLILQFINNRKRATSCTRWWLGIVALLLLRAVRVYFATNCFTSPSSLTPSMGAVHQMLGCSWAAQNAWHHSVSPISAAQVQANPVVGSGVGWEGAYKATSTTAVAIQNCLMKPSCSQHGCCCRAGRTTLLLFGRVQWQQPLIRLANPLRFSGPARPRDDKKNKRWNKVCQPYLEG